MAGALESPPRDGLVTFMPHRLNRHPVVVRGLTADELWVCAGLSGTAGLVVGVPLAWLTHSIAMVPTLIVAGIGIGVFVGGGLLRRWKRGRPDTWLYRQLQWRLALRHPALAALLGGQRLNRPGDEDNRTWLGHIPMLDPTVDPVGKARHRPGLLAVLGLHHFQRVGQARDHGRQHLARNLVVIDQQDLHGHRFPKPRAVARLNMPGVSAA
mgnify:CR=1 FL=1